MEFGEHHLGLNFLLSSLWALVNKLFVDIPFYFSMLDWKSVS